MKKVFVIFVFFMAGSILAGDPVPGWKVETNKSGGASKTGENNQVYFEVYNEKGEKVYSVSKSLPFDVPYPSASIFQAGELMVVYSFDGVIEFYNNKGELVNTIKPNYNTKPEFERSIKFATLDDESVILVSEPENYFSRLLIVTSDGRINIEKDIEGTNATGVVISESGNLIATGTYSWIDTVFLEQTNFFDNEGNFIGKVPLSFTSGKFNAEETEFLGFTNSNLFSVDIEDEKITWTKELQSDQVITDATIDGDKVAYITSELPTLKDGKWYYSRLELELVNDDGEEIISKKLPDGLFETVEFTKYDNTLQINLDNKQVKVE
ncbi:MAG: hypothetical protein C4539_09395 [Ignavibacteriales bacterium]|nr:MAG: hypothetical protein C4539_09395 [Ignavibacteriales bacterium]